MHIEIKTQRKIESRKTESRWKGKIKRRLQSHLGRKTYRWIHVQLDKHKQRDEGWKDRKKEKTEREKDGKMESHSDRKIGKRRDEDMQNDVDKRIKITKGDQTNRQTDREGEREGV